MRIKQIIYLAAAANLFVTPSCHNEKTRIDRLWFFTDSRSGSSAPDTTLSPASFLNIQSNGFYTCDFDRFYYGKWKFEGNKLFLMDNSGMVSSLDVPMLAGNDLQLQRNTESVDYFESQPSSFANDTENPFSKENNLWRIKPAQKETDSQLKLRLLNHWIFWEAYFRWALNNNIQTIDVRSTPTALKIYGNGFVLKTMDQLPKKWIELFFDKDDCVRANGILKNIFEQNNIEVPHTANKYKLFISLFGQMQRMLR